MTTIGHLIVGPAEHGVVRFADQLAGQLGGPVIRLATAAEQGFDAGPLGSVDVVLMQYTDGLYGPETTSAAANFVALRERFDRPAVVTMHDLPDAADDPVRYRRRAAGYRAVMDSVDAVVVSSRHEARLFARFSTLFSPGHAGVVPLPIDPAAPWDGRPEPLPEVAVLGFVYPGKGHSEALAALAGMPAELGFTLIGRAADGHDDLLTALAEQAQQVGRRLDVTGFVPDEVLVGRLRQVAVPVAPSRAISASGSINTWLSAGRRPLVAAGPYTRELADRCPGAITLYEPGELPGLIHAALADPALTWLDADCQPWPSSAEAALAYRDLLTEVSQAADASKSAGTPVP